MVIDNTLTQVTVNYICARTNRFLCRTNKNVRHRRSLARNAREKEREMPKKKRIPSV